MTNRLRPNLYLQFKLIRPSITIFWSIVISIQAALLILLITLHDTATDSSMVFGGTGALYVFSFILGMLTFKDAFPLALSMGATRRSYYLGTQLAYVLLSLFQAALVTILGIVEGIIERSVDVPLQLYHYRLIGASSYVESFVFQFVLVLFLTVMADLCAAWTYKIGRVFLFGIGAIMIIFVSLAVFFGWFSPVFEWLMTIDSYWEGILYILPAAIVCMLLSWLPIRRVELKKS